MKEKKLINSRPDPSLFAEGEIRRYLRAVCGAKHPVSTTAPGGNAVVVQHGKGKDPGRLASSAGRLSKKLESRRDGSYAIRASRGSACIVGKDGGGLVSGVYDFIETALGVRFLEPGRGGEYIPHKRVVRWPDMDRVEEPAFLYRGLPDASSMQTLHLDMIDWMAKNRFNYFHALPWHWDRERSKVLPELEKRGMRLCIFGHCTSHFFPMNSPEAERLMGEHPEYYALIGGRRVPSQICYSNPDAMRFLADRVYDWVKQYPEVEYLCVGANDGNAFCECPECVRIGIGRLLFEVNRGIAGKVRGLGRGITVFHVNYWPGTLQPHPDVEPVPNLVCMYAPYGNEAKFQRIYDYRHGLRRNLHRQEGNHRAICTDIHKWQGTHRMVIASYFSDQIMKGATYTPYPDIIRDDLCYYRAAGVTGFLDILCYRELMWMDALNLRVFARTMWNPDEDLGQILHGFYPAYFGKAAGPAAEFDRMVGELMRIALFHGFLVEDFIRISTFGDNVRDLARDFRPDLDEASCRLMDRWFEDASGVLARAVRDAGREPAAVRRRVARLPACLDNLRWKLRAAYWNVKVAYWAWQAESAAEPARREGCLQLLARVVQEAGTIHAELRKSLAVWKRELREVPGASVIARSFDGRDLLEKYRAVLDGLRKPKGEKET